MGKQQASSNNRNAISVAVQGKEERYGYGLDKQRPDLAEFGLVGHSKKYVLILF